MKRLVVDMSNELHTAIKIDALKKGVSTKELVTKLIEEYLAKEGGDAEHSNF